jgi:phage-related protein
VTTALAGFAKWIGENTTLIYIIVGVVGGLAAAILILNVAMTISTVVIWAMNTAFLASPITWIVIGIIALIAVFVILWNKCEGFRNFFIGMWAAISGAASAAWAGITSATQSAIAWITSAVRVIQTVVTGVWNAILTAGRTAWSALQAVVGGVVNAILGPVHALAAAFNSVVSAIQSVVGWISKIHIPNLGGLAAIVPHSTAGGYAVASASGALRSPRFGVSTAGYSSSVGGTSITVYGGLDSADTIARRISDILQSRTRRTSGVEISRRSA